MTKDPVIAKDFLDALKRLQAGAPRNPKLILQKKSGKLRINVSSVALEAGRSRTLIGYKGCQYPEIRATIQIRRENSTPKAKTQSKQKELRDEIRVLNERLKAADAVNASLLLRLCELEESLDRSMRAEARMSESLSNPDQIIGRASSAIVQFPSTALPKDSP